MHNKYVFCLRYNLNTEERFHYCYNEHESIDKWSSNFYDDFKRHAKEFNNSCMIGNLKFNISYSADAYYIDIFFYLLNPEIFSEEQFTKEKLQNTYNMIIDYINEHNSEFYTNITTILQHTTLAYIPTNSFMYETDDLFWVLANKSYAQLDIEFDCLKIANSFEHADVIENIEDMFMNINENFHLIEDELHLEH